MAADANIFQSLIQQPKSVIDFQNEYDQRDSLRTRDALQSLALQQQSDQLQQSTRKRNALEQVMAGLRPNATDDERANAFAANPLTMDVADQLRKSALDRRKAEAEIGDKTADAAGKRQTQSIKARQDAYAEAAALNTPEDAIAALNRAVTDGKVPMQIVPAFEQMVRTDPLWKLKLLQGALDPEKLKEALMPHMTAAGGALVNTNPLAGQTGQGAPSAIPITQSADNAATQATSRANNAATIAAENTRAAARLAKESSVYDSDRGVVVNKDTGLARPAATMDGKPVGAKDKPLAEGAQKQVIGARNLQDAVKNYREKLAGWGNSQMLSPDARAEMGNAYNNMMLQAKEAYNLGVLNGPDYEILQSVVKDPTKLTSALTSNGALDSQASELARIAAGIEKTALESHGKTYTPRTSADAALPDDIAAIMARHGKPKGK